MREKVNMVLRFSLILAFLRPLYRAERVRKLGSKETGLSYKAQSCVSLVVQELDIALSGFGPERDLRILHLGFQSSPEAGGDP